MPETRELSRRRFLAQVGMLAPLATFAACRRAAPAGEVRGASGLVRSAHVTWSTAGDRLTVSTRAQFGPGEPLCWFNDAGARIWLAIDGRRDAAGLAAHLAGTGPIEPGDIEDVALFVVELARLGLVDGPTHFDLARVEYAVART